MKKIAILQSNYIPWKGYFDLMAAVDEFVFFDDMQYTKRDWRNRNQIKSPKGPQWLTIPVKTRGNFHQTIKDTMTDGQNWRLTHWMTLCKNYRRSPCFKDIAPWLEPLYLGQSETHLSAINQQVIGAICHYLGITTTLTHASDHPLNIKQPFFFH